jgi:hypothetical protein
MAWRQGLPYGQDLRDRVLASRDAGQSVRAVAERFSVRWGNGPRPDFLGSVVVPQNDGVSRNGVGLTLAPSIIGDDHGAVCRY